LKGVSVPEADKDMAVLVNREVDTLLDARISLIPNTRRVKRGDYL
jgi:hypothetical protein